MPFPCALTYNDVWALFCHIPETGERKNHRPHWIQSHAYTFFVLVSFGLSYYVYLKYYVWQGCKSVMDSKRPKMNEIRTGNTGKNFFAIFPSSFRIFCVLFFSFYYSISVLFIISLVLFFTFQFTEKMDANDLSHQKAVAVFLRSVYLLWIKGGRERIFRKFFILHSRNEFGGRPEGGIFQIIAAC